MTRSTRSAQTALPVGCEVPVTGLVTEAKPEEAWVSVTYDEHLGPNTRRILEAFAEYGMAGTFFTVGEEAEENPDLARSILEEGHEIGNHTYHHRDLTQTPDHGRRQYAKGLRAIQVVTGFRTALARPPFGKINDDVVAAAHSLGMTTVKWGRSPFWADPSARHIAEFALERMVSGRIVVLHQNDPGAEALPLILSGLRDRGLRSVPVTQLLGGRFLYSS
jgi:peptidoglycan-N-acetylglucosamine deacetylase